MKPGNDLGRAGLRLSAGCVSHCGWVDAGATIRLSRSRLDGRRITAGSRPGADPSTGSMLSVMLSIGGGIVRHFTSYHVGRWRGRQVEKC